MKALVTGGAGFIGSHVCEALLDRGDKVICLDNFNNYYSPFRKQQNIFPLLSDKNFQFIMEDITNYNAMHDVFDDYCPNKVIHLAARAGVRASIENPLLYQKVNIEGTLNLLELARKNRNIEKFIFASSSSVYGNRNNVPFSEADNVDNPISPYAATKKAGELLCSTYSHLFDIPITCLRFFTVYGSRCRPDMAPYKFTKAISEGKWIERFGDGTSSRDYTHISDIVNGILLALDKNFKFEIINLGDSQPIQLNYFISLIEDAAGKKAKIIQKPMQEGDVLTTYADISKAKKLLNWQPKMFIEPGIDNLVGWFKND